MSLSIRKTTVKGYYGYGVWKNGLFVGYVQRQSRRQSWGILNTYDPSETVYSFKNRKLAVAALLSAGEQGYYQENKDILEGWDKDPALFSR